MVDIKEVTSRLEDVVGPSHVTYRDFDLLPYNHDSSQPEQKMPTNIVMPEARVEIQAILKIANQKNVPVYLRGGRTSY